MPARDAKSPFAEFIAAFLATKESAKELAPKSVSDYGRLLREFDVYTERTDLESALTMANAKNWLREKRADGLNAAINATMYLKSFGMWACKEGYKCGPENVSVLFHLRAPKGKKRVRHALTQQQLDAIWKALADPSSPGGPRATALLRLLLATGLKRSATRTLLLDDFQIDAKGRRGHIIVRKKPYTDVGARKLRLDARTVAAVRAYVDVRPEYAGKLPEPLLLSKDQKGFTENGFGSWVQRITDYIEAETGIPWTTEDMRFTAKEEAKAIIRDPELREKCTEPLEKLEGDTNYEDAVMDACKILEVRVRTVSNPPHEHRSGWKLMQFAFAEPKPAVRISGDPNEQEAHCRCTPD